MDYVHWKMEFYFESCIPALDYFREDFMDIDKTRVRSLIVLDLASLPLGKKKNKMNQSISFLDLSPPLYDRDQFKKYREQWEPYLLHKNIVDLSLKRHCQEYEYRYFNITSVYYNGEIDILEKRIFIFLNLWLGICYKVPNFNKWYIFKKVVNLMIERNVISGYLSWILMEVVNFNEISMSKVFLREFPREIEFIVRSIRKDYDNQCKIQNFICIHDTLRHGSVKVLACLIKMGHEYEFGNVLEKESTSFFYSLFQETKDRLLLIKPEDMSLRRFMLLLHIYFYAEFSHKERVNRNGRFEKKLNMLYMALPDPVVTKKEVETLFEGRLNFLLPRVRDMVSKRLDTVTQNSLPNPRSLQHLARCATRKALNCNRMLPDGIDKLPLPNLLRQYVMLKL